MRIPSYDDLTPSIPDVSQADVFAAVERLLPAFALRASARRAFEPDEPSRGANSPSQLFACLRAVRDVDAVMAVAREFSPRIQRYGTASVVLDIGGLGRLLGDPQAIGGELARAADGRGASIRVAVARTQCAALLLSSARPSLTVADGDPQAALGDVPLASLQQLLADLHGVTVLRAGSRARTSRPVSKVSTAPWPGWPACEHAFDVLRRWGLQTLGEFVALPSAELAARMGQDGVALQQIARGRDPQPLVPDPDVPRFVQAMELEWPIDGLEPLSFVLARLLEPLAGALERADRGAAAIRMDLRLADRTTHRRVLQLPVAMRDPRVLRTLLLLDLESHPPSAAIDVVSIEIDPAPGRVIQYSLLERALPSAETLSTLNARLDALMGEARCGAPLLLDTHRPDGFTMQRFAPDERAGRRLPAARAGAAAGRPSVPAVALLPALRRFRPPVAIRVSVERGRPAAIAIDRRGMPGGRVVQAAGPWRSSGAWWDAASTAWDRDEWDVALGTGAICRIYRDCASAQWFMEAVLD